MKYIENFTALGEQLAYDENNYPYVALVYCFKIAEQAFVKIDSRQVRSKENPDEFIKGAIRSELEKLNIVNIESLDGELEHVEIVFTKRKVV